MTRTNPAVWAGDGEPGAPISADFLRETIVSDLNLAALQVGMLGVKAAACAAPGAKFSLHGMRHLAYDDARVARLALRYGAAAGLPPAVARKLDAFYADLSALRGQMAPFIAAAALAPSQIEKLSRLLPALRKLAQAAVAALGEVAPIVRSRLHANYAHDASALREFLDRAARGETGDVDRFGAVKAPALRHRRAVSDRPSPA